MGNQKHVSNQLINVDKDNYIFDGTLCVIEELTGIHAAAKLNEDSVIKTVAEYKKTRIDRGIAFGSLQQDVVVDTDDEISDDDLKNVNNFNIKLNQDFEEEELTEDDIAFQIIDMVYDKTNRRILGRIVILDTPQGLKARKKIDEGLMCYISSSGIKDVVERDKSVNPDHMGRWAFSHRLKSFKEGWKLSFIGRGGGFRF